MRRVVLAFGGTIAGLAALLSFKMHPPATLAGAAQPVRTAAAPPSASANGHPSAAPSASGAASAPRPAAKASPSAAAAKSPAVPAAPAKRVLTGQVISTPYGPMQVQVTLLGQKITNVQVLQQTDMGSYSQQLDSSAIPQLTQEAITAQSANVNAISGATYTSSGYAQSLQGALDQAKA